ncbi:hypothetical protein [Pelagerythrobacter marensis]|uniref:hypothetical protein n=1 Tax=Pelagerythrobacter marensis TaxID=543877 RepID=UPI0014705C1B|nr:hypothetical protein [Pelagerythrobacter marensis]
MGIDPAVWLLATRPAALPAGADRSPVCRFAAALAACIVKRPVDTPSVSTIAFGLGRAGDDVFVTPDADPDVDGGRFFVIRGALALRTSAVPKS